MSRLRVSINLGAEASVGELRYVVAHFSTVHDLAVQWADAGARASVARVVEQQFVESREIGRFYEQLRAEHRADLQAYLEATRLWEERYPPDIMFEEWYRFMRRGSLRFPAAALWNPLMGPPPPREAVPEAFSRLVDLELASSLGGPPSVESLRYENPWEIVLAAGGTVLGGGALRGLAVLVRDWRAERRQAEAEAERVEAEADRTRAEAREIRARASQEETKAKVLEAAAGAVLQLNDRDEEGVLVASNLKALLDANPDVLDSLAALAALEPAVEELPETGD